MAIQGGRRTTFPELRDGEITAMEDVVLAASLLALG